MVGTTHTSSLNVTVQPRSPSHAVLELPAPSFSSPPVRNRRFQGTALAAAAFILSGVALLFMCKRLSSSLAEVRLTHRRQADSNGKDGTPDGELDATLTECLKLEAEHGEPPSDTDLVEPAAKRAKLITFWRKPPFPLSLRGSNWHFLKDGAPNRQARHLQTNSGGLVLLILVDFTALMRERFLRPMLGPEEVEELMCAAESLVRYASTRIAKQCLIEPSPTRIIRQIELYFMTLISLVCARHLVGPHMVSEMWWDALASSVFTDYDVGKPYQQDPKKLSGIAGDRGAGSSGTTESPRIHCTL
ncbi:hypothetical protein Esti_003251 [Eimeria stiedai]